MNLYYATQPQFIESEQTYEGMKMLYEIEDTIAELEIYIARNPEDDIAQRQYKHFLTKREKWAVHDK